MNAPAIRLADVAFSYGASPPVLALEEVVVSPGERVFIEGPSGSGKSTLLALVGGVVVPSRGVVEIFGEQVSALSAAARDRFRADHMGFVFQMFNLLPYLSVQDNVLLPCRFSKARARQAADGSGQAALLDEAKRLLARLGLGEGFLPRSAASLSIGQQQRVAAARALMGRPEVIIADEPTSALDADNRARFVRLLIDECAAANSTVLFASHDPANAALFDRHLSMRSMNAAWSPNDG